MSSEQLVRPDRLTNAAIVILVACGVPQEDARIVAESLVQADLWGHQSHGVMRLSWYVRRFQSGAMLPVSKGKKIIDSGAVVVIDGGHGVGQVLATKAMREAIRRAKGYGLGAVAVRNSNHFGTAMQYSLMGPARGCVAMVCTNASPAMAPWGGREKRVGTNPWSLAAPAGLHAPMVLDIANTAVARGKVHLAKQNGHQIPEGWALDAHGAPTTDPVAAIAGLIAPMAGHKGYAIAVMMDVLAGVLTGSAYGKDVHGPYEPTERSGCGHLMIALNIETFLRIKDFEVRMEQLIAELKETPLAGGVTEIFYPGELEARNAVVHQRDGLCLPQATVEDLVALAKALGVAPLQ